MSVEILETYFGIKPERTIHDGHHIRHVMNEYLYTLIPVTHMEEQVLLELYEMSEHMAKLGDQKVSLFVPSKEGKYLITHKDQDYVLLYNYSYPVSRQKNIGRQLALFHGRGMELNSNIVELNRVGQWKSFWITRLEQLERVWSNKAYESTGEMFEKLFIETFPYYLGLSENAIQYVTDTEMDETPHYNDRATITHQQFHSSTWKSEVRNPFEWVVDHPGRDVAEWIRHCYFQKPKGFQPEMNRFIGNYESLTPLSPFGWRLVYARLLFPLHYFHCIEEYFLTNSEARHHQLEETLQRYIRDARNYELFLGHFPQLVGIEQFQIPTIDWLTE